MKKYLVLALLLTQAACGETHHSETIYVPQEPDKANVQQTLFDHGSTTHGALEACAYEVGKPPLEILKSTVGLHKQSQLEALYDFVKLVCVEKRQLDKSDGLDENGARDAINKSLKRAVIEVFATTDL